jgi:hypothetical protein
LHLIPHRSLLEVVVGSGDNDDSGGQSKPVVALNYTDDFLTIHRRKRSIHCRIAFAIVPRVPPGVEPKLKSRKLGKRFDVSQIKIFALKSAC